MSTRDTAGYHGAKPPTPASRLPTPRRSCCCHNLSDERSAEPLQASSRPLGGQCSRLGGKRGGCQVSGTLRVATYNIHKGVQGVGFTRRLEIHNIGHAV